MTRKLLMRAASALWPALLAAGLVAAPAAPAAAAAAPEFYDLPAGARILSLDNGLRVLLLPNPAQPMVGIYTMVEVGSAYEDLRTSGMSHMLEHLLFNGTVKYAQDELYAQADLHGAYNNAHTSDWYTGFMMVLPAEHLEVGLDLQSQMLFHSTLPPEKFAKEQGIVLGELVAARDRPGHFAETTLREVTYAGTPLALPTLGTRTTIAGLHRDEVYDFYRRHYVPNNMLLVLAGGFDPGVALPLVEQYYGEAEPASLERPARAPVFFSDQTRTVVRRGGAQRELDLIFDAPTYGAPAFFPFLLATRLLDAPGTGIVTTALEQLPPEQRPRFGAWWEKSPGFGRLVLSFDLPPAADPQRLWPLVQEAVAAALARGISEDQLAGIVQMERTETLLGREQLRHLGIFAAETLVLGGPDLFVGWLDRLGEVGGLQVADALREYLLDAPALALLIEPAEGEEGGAGPGGMPGMGGMPAGMGGMPGGMPAGMPGGAAPAIPGGMPGGTPAAAPGATSGGAAGGSGGSGEPGEPGGAPEAAPARGPADLKVERSVLGDGAVLVTLQNPSSRLMAVHLTVRNRSDLDDGHPGTLDLVHHLLEDGVTGCDEACLAARLRRLGAVVKLYDDPRIPMDDYYTTGRFSYVRVECAAENGPAMLEVLAQMIRDADFDQADFEQERADLVRALRERRGSAREVAGDLLREALYGENPLSRPPEGTVESLEDVDFQEARSLYSIAFMPANLVIAVVSPLPHAMLAARLQQLLPGVGTPTAMMAPAAPTTGAARVTGSVGGPMTAIRLGSLLDVDPADGPALELLVSILSDRVQMDLRESRGLSYSTGASLDLFGRAGRFTAWLNPPRERAAEGEKALTDLVAGFDPASVTDEELQKTRSARIGRLMMRRLASMGQAYYLAMAELEGDLAGYADLFDRYRAVTLDDLRRVGRTYLAGMPLVTVVVD